MALAETDRRKGAKAGLAILAFGFVISPTVHAVLGHGGTGFDPASLDAWATHGIGHAEADHDESTPHSHHEGRSEGQTHSHPDGSLEHLGACCAPAVDPPTAAQLVWAFEEFQPALMQVPEGRRVRSPAMPQGP